MWGGLHACLHAAGMCCPVCGGRDALFVALTAARSDAKSCVQSLYRSVLVNTSFAGYGKRVQGFRQRGWAQGQRTCNPGRCNRCSACGAQPRRMLCCFFLILLPGAGAGALCKLKRWQQPLTPQGTHAGAQLGAAGCGGMVWPGRLQAGLGCTVRQPPCGRLKQQAGLPFQ